MKILIIEDSPSLREIMSRVLRQEGYVVESAATYLEADSKVAGYSYDCILLDVMLPDGNGLKLLEHIRNLGKRENVIIVSARDSLEDKVSGLELGADDYLPKPFHTAELIARVKSVLRRGRTAGELLIEFGNVTINDLPNIYTTAQKCGKTRVFLFARGIERKALRLLETYGIYITIVKIKAIYKLLKKHNLLPDLKKKRTFRLQDLPAIFISKSNFKGLIFSGVVLLSTAFFTPLKIYYLIFGSIALLLAIISLSPLGKDMPSQRQNFKEFFAGLNANAPNEKNVGALEKDGLDDKIDDDKKLSELIFCWCEKSISPLKSRIASTMYL